MDARKRQVWAWVVVTVVVGAALAHEPAPTRTSPASRLTLTATTSASLAQAAYDRMSNAQRIGQLFMVGGSVTGLSSATKTAISSYHVGNLILTGRTTAGAPPVRALVSGADRLTTNAATAAVPLFVATDQEGGAVQVLQGSGFSRMPYALTQGTWSDTTLTASAKTWGIQLARAGADVNLAPVMDTVPASLGTANPPIGKYYREFGYTPSLVAEKGSAFARGMRAAGVDVTVKHFPGLGHVLANTDTSSGVKDTVTTRTSGDLAPFRAGVAAGAKFVMVSSAIYTKIDSAHPAVFSPTVITGMIRSDLGFQGIVVSDDLGNAVQVAAYAPGTRAVSFIDSGGDMVLTVDPSDIPAMVQAVTSRAATSLTFAAKVKTSVMRVLNSKAAAGLLASRLAVDGNLGTLTKSALQRWLGIPVTGILDTASIKALQARVGTTADGQWGRNSMAALQAYLGTYADGATTWNSRTVALLQAYLNTQL